MVAILHASEDTIFMQNKLKIRYAPQEDAKRLAHFTVNTDLMMSRTVNSPE
jgi:hypothetical protein